MAERGLCAISLGCRFDLCGDQGVSSRAIMRHRSADLPKPNNVGRRKYQSENLIRMFRKAATLRNEMLAEGFTDNGGAIHSAERILNILGLHLKYPDLSHINNLRHYKGAEFSTKALAAHRAGGRVMIEHVSPIRDFTRKAIKIAEGESDEQLKKFVRNNYRLVLLTPAETLSLNKQNRSKMIKNRLVRAGIKMAPLREIASQ